MKHVRLFIFFATFFLYAHAYERFGVQGVGVPFHEGMSNFEWYRAHWINTDNGWAVAHKQYTDYVVDNCEYQEEPRIPKIIHQIWIGSELPDKYIPLIDSWKELHPDWTYKLWTDADIEALGLVNKDQYDASTNYGQKADIARYEILYRFGGVYIDIDFECLRPLDIFHHICDYYTGAAYSGRFSTFNGLIGSAPGNAIVQACIETLDINAYYEGTDEHNILFSTGPFHQARCFVAHAHEAGRAVAFPVNYFYPWPFSHKEDIYNLSKWYKPETFAIHYWHCGWRKDAQKKMCSMNMQLNCDQAFTGCYPYFEQNVCDIIASAWQHILDVFTHGCH